MDVTFDDLIRAVSFAEIKWYDDANSLSLNVRYILKASHDIGFDEEEHIIKYLHNNFNKIREDWLAARSLGYRLAIPE